MNGRKWTNKVGQHVYTCYLTGNVPVWVSEDQTFWKGVWWKSYGEIKYFLKQPKFRPVWRANGWSKWSQDQRGLQSFQNILISTMVLATFGLMNSSWFWCDLTFVSLNILFTKLYPSLQKWPSYHFIYQDRTGDKLMHWTSGQLWWRSCNISRLDRQLTSKYDSDRPWAVGLFF